MSNKYVWCAVNEAGDVQTIHGSSRRTRYYETDKYLGKAIQWHNLYYPEEPWYLVKFKLEEVNRWAMGPIKVNADE